MINRLRRGGTEDQNHAPPLMLLLVSVSSNPRNEIFINATSRLMIVVIKEHIYIMN